MSVFQEIDLHLCMKAALHSLCTSEFYFVGFIMWSLMIPNDSEQRTPIGKVASAFCKIFGVPVAGDTSNITKRVEDSLCVHLSNAENTETAKKFQKLYCQVCLYLFICIEDVSD